MCKMEAEMFLISQCCGQIISILCLKLIPSLRIGALEELQLILPMNIALPMPHARLHAAIDIKDS